MKGPRRYQDALSSSGWLVKWLWLAILVPFPPKTKGYVTGSVSGLDSTPRAALVTLAHENDLEPLLSSMSQLEDSFNNRYKYDWVFFGIDVLSDKFRQLTSNATTATCIYEVARQSDVDTRRINNMCHSQVLPSQISPPAPSPTRNDLTEPLQSIRQIQRWNNGPFANEKRLQTYDWFWRVEPGAQFTHDVNFDVFRFMRDHNIAYGSNRASLGPIHMTSLSQDVKRFLEKHPELLHAEANVSWLLDSSDIRYGSNMHSGNSPETPRSATTNLEHEKFIRDWWPLRSCVQQVNEETTSAPAEAFTAWLRTFGASSDIPKFEIGSLAFFRSYNHQTLLEHFDGLSNPHDSGLRDLLVPTISASIFLPQKSVWNFRRKERSLPHPPDSTPEPKPRLWHRMKKVVRNESSLRPLRYKTAVARDDYDAMRDRFAIWDKIAEDFDRQETIPSLRSGNTVIDERNFALG